MHKFLVGFPADSESIESACNAGVQGSIPGTGRSPGRGQGNSLQCSCLENPHGQRSLEGYSPWGHKELDTTEQLMHAHTHTHTHTHARTKLSVKSLHRNRSHPKFNRLKKKSEILYFSQYQHHQNLFNWNKDSAKNKVEFSARVTKSTEGLSLRDAGSEWIPAAGQRNNNGHWGLFLSEKQDTGDIRPCDILFSKQGRTQLQLPKERRPSQHWVCLRSPGRLSLAGSTASTTITLWLGAQRSS